MEKRMVGRVLMLTMLSAGIATAQTQVVDQLAKYLGLSSDQLASINKLSDDFSTYWDTQSKKFFNLANQAQHDLAQTPPDPNSVGQEYAQMEMIRRDYYTQLAQLQTNVAAVLTPSQVVLANALLQVERLQPVVQEAVCVSLMGPLFTSASVAYIPVLSLPTISTPTCQTIPPLPVALSNYLTLTDSQVSTMENTIAAHQDYISRQSLKIKELQNQIKDLTAASTIDAASLGAAYVAIVQIDNDESTQANQLRTTLRSVITDAQKPLLQSLDDAQSNAYVATNAVCTGVLVLPPDLQNQGVSYSYTGNFLLKLRSAMFPQAPSRAALAVEE
jgi:hypothetical protein